VGLCRRLPPVPSADWFVIQPALQPGEGMRLRLLVPADSDLAPRRTEQAMAVKLVGDGGNTQHLLWLICLIFQAWNRWDALPFRKREQSS